MSQVRLVIICGLPASGKTTLARQIAETRDAVRMSPDEWMISAGIDLWDAEARASIEELQRSLTKRLLAQGRSVIIGGRPGDARNGMLSETMPESWEWALNCSSSTYRSSSCWSESLPGAFEERFGGRPPTLEELKAREASFERPTEDEMTLFDEPTAD